METATITFKDGTQIEAEANGNCFALNEEPDFPDDLTQVIITKDGNTETLSYVQLQECAPIDNRYWFTFVPLSEYEKLEAQVLYTALITDTLIEEE